MEEQRQRQEDEARRTQATETPVAKPETIKEAPNEEAMLKRALAMSLEAADEVANVTEAPPPSTDNIPDFARMSEEEQIAFAMQMSMQDQRNNNQFLYYYSFIFKQKIELLLIY